jgi:protein-S-isoprenylcysteine O-methyltransferase Ste14
MGAISIPIRRIRCETAMHETPVSAPDLRDLRRKSLRGLLQFTLLTMLLVFLPAWSVDYWQAWLFLGIFVPSLALCGAYFLRRDPALVRRRLKVGPTAEREPAQKRIQAAASLLLAALFVVSALDHRFGWSRIPAWAVVLGDGAVVAGLLLMSRVFVENSFAAATVQVEAGQRVIETGPYAWVRHPMYGVAVVMLAGIPPALDSAWGLLLIPPAVVVLAMRLRAEEAYLERHLSGYAEYRGRVRWRLLPGVW